MSKKRPRSREATVEIGPKAVVAGVLLVALVAVIFVGFARRAGPSASVGGPGASAGTAMSGTSATGPNGEAGLGASTGPGTGAGTGANAPAGGAIDPMLGVANAPVTIVEYGDYLCPNCRSFTLDVLPWMKETWIAQGMVRLVFKDFAIRGEESIQAAQAAHCAGDQGRYWPYHERLYKAQLGGVKDPYGRDNLVQLAKDSGLEEAAFATCLDDERYRSVVEASTQYATSQGFEGTPTFVVNGRTVAGAIEKDRWNQLFEAYRQGLGGSGQP